MEEEEEEEEGAFQFGGRKRGKKTHVEATPAPSGTRQPLVFPLWPASYLLFFSFKWVGGMLLLFIFFRARFLSLYQMDSFNVVVDWSPDCLLLRDL